MKADDADVVRVWGRLLELLAKYNEKHGDYYFRVWSDGNIGLLDSRRELGNYNSPSFEDIEEFYDYLIRHTQSIG